MCNQCDHKTTNKTGLKEHLRSKHGAEKLRCDMCDFQSVSARGIAGHRKRIHEDKKHFCDHCDYTNRYVTFLTEHVERKHSKTQNIKCDKYKYETSVKINLKTHMKYQHDTIEMKCNLCSFSGNRIMLCHHKKNSHGDLRQCTECDYKTRGTANMSNRQRVKHQGISFVGL